MFAQLFKQVLLVVFCCSWIGSSRKLKCNDLLTKEDEYWTFKLKVPVSRHSYIVFTQVQVSWDQNVVYGTKLSILTREEIEGNIFELTYAIKPPVPVRSMPNIMEIDVGTADLCILYCKGKPEVRANMGRFNISREENLYSRPSGRRHCTSYKPVLPPLPKNCGRVLGSRVIKGNEMKQGTRPWLVPIYIKDQGSIRFKCGGNIISSQTVLTSAHCLTDDVGKKYKADVVKIFAGRHNLTNFNEEDYTSHNAEEIIVHPLYNGGHNHDIGLINLETEITFEWNRKPVCVWSNITSVDESIGTVAGWGITEQGVASAVPFLVEQTIVSPETCKRTSRIYRTQNLTSTICARGFDGSGPCKGDSGGGLMLMDQNGRYSIRGLVSMTQQEEETKSCTLQNFVLYTDVAKYFQWIRNGMW